MQKDSGSFKIVIMREPYSYWPSTQIAGYLGEDITDTVPAFEDADADTFAFEVDDDGLWITIHYEYEEDENGDEIEYDMEEAANNYVNTLKENGFFKIMEDENGNEYYVSKNLQVVVEVEYDDVWDEIYVFINTVEALTAGKWPEQHINYFLDLHHYTDELPAYEGDFVSAEATIGLSTLKIDVVLDTNDAEEIKAAADSYIETLEQAGFEYFEELGEGQCKRYYSPNKEYEVSVMYQPDGFTVQIDEIANERQVTTTFPTEELYAAHPELEDVLPVVVEGEATFDTQIQSDWVEIFVMYEDASLIPAAMEAYATTLTTAGFIPGNTDGSFISPNSQFTVDLIEGIDGAFLIELALVRHLNSEVSAFLASRGKSVAFPDLSSYESYGVDWDYTGVSSGRWETWINGNHEETLAAAFAAAGYTGTDAPNEDVGAYLMYDATDSITVQMAYVASYQQTLIRIYPSHVEPN